MPRTEGAPTFAIGRCPGCGRRVRLRIGRRFRCGHPRCRRVFSLEEACPTPSHFGLSSDDANRFSARIGIPSWLRFSFFLLLAIPCAAICSAKGESVALCIAVGTLASLPGAVLLTKCLEQPVRSVRERWRRQEKLYPNFLQWASALAAYQTFCKAVAAEEQRRIEEQRRKEEEGRCKSEAQRRKREEAERIALAEERRKREEERRKREEAKRKQVEWWKKLDGWKFEKEIAQLLKRKGFQVSRTGKPGDSGVDLVLMLSGRKIVVQCKAHKTRIAPGTVRDLYGTLTAERAEHAWLISTQGFTPGARKFARGKPIRLMTIEDVLFGTLE